MPLPPAPEASPHVSTRPRFRGRKQLLLKLGVFLLLGAIVSVVIAWECAVPDRTYAFPSGDRIEGVKAIDLWNRVAPAGLCQADDVYGFRARSPIFRGMLLIASDPMQPPCQVKGVDRGPLYWFHAYEFGFPMQSMGFEFSAKDCMEFTEQRSYASIKIGRTGSKFVPMTVPLRPLWPGFAINTIFYAATLWLLWIAPGKIRRFIRVHRGRCPACGYIIAPGTAAASAPRSGPCSECGHVRG